jgi:hypothetical protein
VSKAAPRRRTPKGTARRAPTSWCGFPLVTCHWSLVTLFYFQGHPGFVPRVFVSSPRLSAGLRGSRNDSLAYLSFEVNVQGGRGLPGHGLPRPVSAPLNLAPRVRYDLAVPETSALSTQSGDTVFQA